MNFRTQKKNAAPTPTNGVHLTITAMLEDTKKKDFSTEAVLERLDRHYAFDKAQMERRLAEYQPLDLGKP